jgi:alkylation response protein AidB-like acyl-CoA dehydrogenase
MTPHDAATTLGSLADERTSELDDRRRIPEDIDRAARISGLYRSLVPEDMGGTGFGPLQWFHDGVELARHEPSLGWVVTQGAAELGWIAAGADPTWAKEVLSDPLGASASTVAGMGTLSLGDEPTFEGRWGFNTGVHGATWVGGLAIVDGAVTADGLPVLRWGWVPAERATILDDWDPSGLRGTGSSSIVIERQPIRPEWTFSPFDPTEHDRGPFRVLVGNGLWPIGTSAAATQLGAARRAIDEARAIVETKAPPPTFQPLALNASVQRALIRAEGLWRACHASVENELGAMWDEATRNGELARERRVALFAANVTASEQAQRIVASMCEITGTASVARSHPLARARRDIEALAGHVSVSGVSIELAAQVSLGLIESDIRV